MNINLKKNHFAMMIALFFSVLSFGQNHTLEDVGRNALMSSGTIVEHNVIKGYFYFYFSEKISRKMNNYQIVLLDDNLKEIASELCTKLYVYGSNGLGISSVNPLGGNAIYNFDYYFLSLYIR